jgi:cytochrome P450
MFLLAGYETTANSLSFLVYYLSTHPEAQEKLQHEVDSVLGGRPPALEDLPKVTLHATCR